MTLPHRAAGDVAVNLFLNGAALPFRRASYAVAAGVDFQHICWANATITKHAWNFTAYVLARRLPVTASHLPPTPLPHRRRRRSLRYTAHSLPNTHRTLPRTPTLARYYHCALPHLHRTCAPRRTLAPCLYATPLLPTPPATVRFTSAIRPSSNPPFLPS